MHAHRPHPCAFTLVEAAISIVIVAVMFVAALSTLAGAARSRGLQAQWRRADLLGNSLMREILQTGFGDSGSLIVGINLSGDRTGYDDIDDYHELTERPPSTRDGDAIPGCADWTRSVIVERVSVSDPAGSGIRGASSSPLKRITITVTAPDRKTYTFVALRSPYNLFDATPAHNTFGGASVKLIISGVPSALYTEVELPNHPAAPEP